MKYAQPHGVDDPNAGYINGNPATGTEGSIPPARALEAPQREIQEVIVDAGLTPSEVDNTQLKQALQRLRGARYLVDTGAENALIISPNGITGYAAGQRFLVKVKVTNTGATTINVNGLGAKSIKRPSGSALQPLDLIADRLVTLSYNGTEFELSGVNDFAVQSGSTNYAVAGGSANALTATLAPVPTQYRAGMHLRVKATATNTGATTINVNGLGAKSIKRPDGNDLAANDILNGQVVEITYDGSAFMMISPNIAAFTGAGGGGGGGTPGANGSVWYHGAGAPDNGVGANGDYYIRDTTYDMYQKSAGAWGSPFMNLKGGDGAAGAAGLMRLLATVSGSSASTIDAVLAGPFDNILWTGSFNANVTATEYAEARAHVMDTNGPWPAYDASSGGSYTAFRMQLNKPFQAGGSSSYLVNGARQAGGQLFSNGIPILHRDDYAVGIGFQQFNPAAGGQNRYMRIRAFGNTPLAEVGPMTPIDFTNYTFKFYGF